MDSTSLLTFENLAFSAHVLNFVIEKKVKFDYFRTSELNIGRWHSYNRH